MNVLVLSHIMWDPKILQEKLLNILVRWQSNISINKGITLR